MLLSVFESLGYNSTQVDKMLETEIIYGNDNVIGSVKSYLEQIVIQYPYLLSDTYRNTINKFCTLAQLQLLQMDNGDLKFVSARPIATNDELENTIQINAKEQFSTLDRTAIVKNKINTVEIETSITLKKAKEVFSEGDDGISVSQMGREETVILKEVHHDNGVFYLKGDKFRYRVSFNMNNISEIFIKNIEEFKIKLTREKRNKQNLYKDGWFNSAVNTTESESSESFYPNIVSKYQNGDILNFEIEVIMGTYDSGDFIDGYTWSTYTTTSKSFVVEVDCIEKNNQNTLYGLGLAQNKTSIQGNELLQNVTMYKNEKISSIISENILKDYSDGIADGSITVSCADYYNKNGEKTKEWASGQIIEVGDIIVPKKDNLGTSLVNYRNGNEYKWRVKSATFRKGGIPFLDLQVQEIRQP